VNCTVRGHAQKQKQVSRHEAATSQQSWQIKVKIAVCVSYR